MEETDKVKTKPEQERKAGTLKAVGTVEQADMDLINKHTRTPLNADQVYTMKLQLCDNEIDRQFDQFTPNALQQLATLFVGKTVIFDHSWSAKNQTARIYSTEVEAVQGKTNSKGEPYLRLNAMAYMLWLDSNADIIAAIDGGILKEGSVGFSNTKDTCSICGNEYYSMDCPHWRGQVYTENGVQKVCTIILDGITDAFEFSFVAVPAQREAGITKGLKSGRALSKETLTKLKAARDCRNKAAELLKQASDLEEQARGIEDDLVGEWPGDADPEETLPDGSEDSDEVKAFKAEILFITGGNKND